jgi:AAA domain
MKDSLEAWMDSEDIAEADEPTARPLHLLTTDILLADLISGRAIITGQSTRFDLPTAESRAILDWYRRNRPKWSGNLQAQDCEAIIDSIADEPPALAAPLSSGARGRQVLRLVKLVAHRFAGLHAYGSADDPPEDFVFEPAKAITLFEGWNGSGKTSLANAVIWCLTGQLLRAQRLPEGGSAEFSCEVDRDNQEASEHLITPVTPLPSGAMWVPTASAKVVPADTWVELTFVDADGNVLPPIRRTQSRRRSGKLEETAPAPNSLPIDPIAFRLGTTMPGILPYLQVGTTSELGVAVARLTGLADLVDLAKHASKAQQRVSGPITKERREQLEEIDLQFGQVRSDLRQRIGEFPTMAPASAPPNVADTGAAAEIEVLNRHFVVLKADGLAAAKDVLGDGFDAEKAEHRENLENSIGPAVEQLKKISALPSMERLGALKLQVDEITNVDALLSSLRQEAETLAGLAANPTLARRTQLYARVAAWMTEHGEACGDKCGVCRGPLEGVLDPETGVLIVDHLERVRQDSDFVSKTIADWASSWTGTLSRDLPAGLRGELGRDLPAAPTELLRSALVDELFATDGFVGTLAALRPSVQAITAQELGALPAFTEPTIKDLPEILRSATANLAKMLRRIERALAFIEWMAAHREMLVAALTSIRRGPVEAALTNDAIGPKLDKLALIVKGVEPISAAITLTGRMANILSARNKKANRISACTKAAEALAAIVPIGALAQAQVDDLRTQLHDRSEYWRDQVYQNATTFSPKPQQTGMDAKGTIDIYVGRGGVRAPAQHVANASALRAFLFGFYLAFREHVIGTSGGLSLLILDDPQDLLDYDNRQRLARALTQLAAGGAQVLATTHDRGFARTLVAEARTADLVEHRSVHPINASRRTLETSLATEELDRKRLAFINNIDSASDAQDYANAARIFLEARLGDLFDDPAYPAWSITTRAPTLIPLFDRLRGLVAGRSNELFKSPVVVRFCSHAGMADGAEARRILNASHHDKASISYADVQRVDDDLRGLRTGMERVHEEFRRYRWREPVQPAERSANVVLLQATRAPVFDVPVCQDIAAFTGNLPSGGSQDEAEEVLSSTWFDDKALFYIRHDTMGFAIPAGSVAIVEVDASGGRDHDLVIARRGTQTYARRLLRPRNGEGLSLAAEMPDPRRSRPTLSFEDHGVEIHRIVGALFSRLPPPEGREEASEIDSVPALARVEVAYRVREESAVPLALPGQTVLGGRALTARDLDGLEGELIAVTLDDGTSILKRVGARLPGGLAHLRLFETIGGLGESAVIATEPVEADRNIPVMLYARPVIGVIYDL